MVSKVTIPESLFEALLLHAFSDEGNEIMGLLIGELKTNDNEADDDEENGKCIPAFNSVHTKGIGHSNSLEQISS